MITPFHDVNIPFISGDTFVSLLVRTYDIAFEFAAVSKSKVQSLLIFVIV